MKNLISLEQIVEQKQIEFEKGNSLSLNILYDIFHSANALKQPPQLNHFVPAVFKDGDWRVLDRPIDISELHPRDWNNHHIEIDEYETALKDVIFDGWEVGLINGSKIYLQSKNELENINFNLKDGSCYDFKYYSDLTKYNLPLNKKGCEKFKL